jgi:hypothetical protein
MVRQAKNMVLAPGSVSNIFLLFVSAMGLDVGEVGLPYIRKLLRPVLGAGAGVECCRAKPVDPAGEVSVGG